MNAYQTLTTFPNGRMSDAYVITARTIQEAYRAADALALIHGTRVEITSVTVSVPV